MGLDERAEAELRLLAGVVGQFSAQIGFRQTPERVAEMLRAQIPSSGLRGLLTLEGAVVSACDQTAKAVERRTIRTDVHNYLVTTFRNIVTGKDAPRAAERVSRDSTPEDFSSRDDAKFIGAAMADLRDATREIRAMPESRHRRVEAIEAWRNSLGALPRPTWALCGSDSPEAFERARRGLPADPNGPTVQRRVEFVRDMPEFRRPPASSSKDPEQPGDPDLQRAYGNLLDAFEDLGNGTTGR